MDVLRKFGISAEQIRRQTKRMLKESPVATTEKGPSPSQRRGQKREEQNADGGPIGHRSHGYGGRYGA